MKGGRETIPPKDTTKDNNINNPLKNAKETLNTVSGLPPIDVDGLINNLLKKTENSIANQVDWQSAYKALSSDNNNQDINEVVKQISSLDFITSSSHMDRLNKYKEFITILKKVPVIKKILRLYTSNILAPDDITKVSLKTVPRNPTVNKLDEEYVGIDAKFRIIIDKINLEDHLYNLVFKTLFYGDMFVEILSSKKYLLQTIYNLQIPIKDEHVKLNESLNNNYDDSVTFNMIGGGNGRESDISYQVHIEWQKPIHTQINETVQFATNYYNSLLESLSVNDSNYNRGIIKYISEQLFGHTDMLDSYDTLKNFTESLDGFVGANDSQTNNIDSNEYLNKKYSLDYLPIQSTLSSLHIKIHTPDKIIILKDDEIEYGYLFINEGINAISNANNGKGGNASTTSVGGVSATSVIGSSNFLSGGNAMAMFGSNNTNKADHARQISNRIYEYIKSKFEEYEGDVNINNLSPNLQMLIADMLNNGSNTITIRYIPPFNIQHFKIEGTGFNNPYGESIVEDLLFRAKMLLADDINGIVSKLTSSGKRLLWTVTANTHQQAANRIQQLSKAVNKKTVSVDNCIDIMNSAIFQNDNIFTAKVNGERQVELETLDLGESTDSTDKNMYMIKQLITGADVPPAHLGYEEWTSGKNTLSNENAVFAQSIVGFQKQFSNCITSLIQKIYLAIFSYTNDFNINFKNLLIALNSPRGIALATFADNATSMSTIVGSLTDLKINPKALVNMFWPELYDKITEAQTLIDKLNDESKAKGNSDEGGAGDAEGFSGDLPGEIGGNLDTKSLEGMVDSGGAEGSTK